MKKGESLKEKIHDAHKILLVHTDYLRDNPNSLSYKFGLETIKDHIDDLKGQLGRLK